jgi:hypothetical protein
MITVFWMFEVKFLINAGGLEGVEGIPASKIEANSESYWTSAM